MFPLSFFLSSTHMTPDFSTGQGRGWAERLNLSFPQGWSGRNTTSQALSLLAAKLVGASTGGSGHSAVLRQWSLSWAGWGLSPKLTQEIVLALGGREGNEGGQKARA